MRWGAKEEKHRSLLADRYWLMIVTGFSLLLAGLSFCRERSNGLLAWVG
jgi:hypothetical protein